MTTIDLWRELPVLLAFPAQVLFVVIYSVPFFGAGQWWKDFVGRALFLKSTAMSLLLFAAFIQDITTLVHGTQVNYYWNFQGADNFVVIGYWLVAVAIYYQLSAIIHQRFPANQDKSARRV